MASHEIAMWSLSALGVLGAIAGAIGNIVQAETNSELKKALAKIEDDKVRTRSLTALLYTMKQQIKGDKIEFAMSFNNGGIGVNDLSWTKDALGVIPPTGTRVKIVYLDKTLISFEVLGPEPKNVVLGAATGPVLVRQRVSVPDRNESGCKRTVSQDGSVEKTVWHNRLGQIHRENGPAILIVDKDSKKVFSQHWYRNGKLHREDGPAITYADGQKEWWLNGIKDRAELWSTSVQPLGFSGCLS